MRATRFSARILAVGPDVDLALLEVADDSFFNDLQPVEWSMQLPSLRSRVSVRGAVGGSVRSDFF